MDRDVRSPGRYNWLLQYYLRAEGLTLSWVGTGRCLASFDYNDADYAELREKLLAAARAMRDDCWWLSEAEQPKRDRRLRGALLREVAASLVPTRIWQFTVDVMHRKHDDHEASHNHPTNRALHLLSSSVFIFCYGLLFADLTLAMFLGLSALVVRQLGHAVFEPPCHDKEKLLLGLTTKSKSVVVAVYLTLPLLQLWGASGGVWETLVASAPTIALHWFVWTIAVIAGHTIQLIHSHGFRNSMIWFVKLATDPMTDVVTYRPRLSLRALRS